VLRLYRVFIKQSSNNISIQGLHRIGKHDIPVYDGSWTEWEAQPDSNYPKATATAA
jgi:3-mercaptopyruvate sulfurtransferase SseA